MTFDGSGDSGQIEEYEFRDVGNADVTTQVLKVDKRDYWEDHKVADPADVRFELAGRHIRIDIDLRVIKTKNYTAEW